jgi:MFS family permease
MLMLASLLPLARMPSIPLTGLARRAPSLAALAAPIGDRLFLRLIAVGCWLSLVNGVSQSAQNASHRALFGFPLFVILAFQAEMRLGQGAICPVIGRLVDRLGNRPVLIVSQLIVATGPLFYFFAAVGDRWWVAAAWVAWIAYAGMNVGLPNLMLKLSPGGNSTVYIAAYFGVTGLVYGSATVAGGWLLDVLADGVWTWRSSRYVVDPYQVLFLVGFAGRLLGVVLLVRLIEPGAWRLRDHLRRSDRPVAPE